MTRLWRGYSQWKPQSGISWIPRKDKKLSNLFYNSAHYQKCARTSSRLCQPLPPSLVTTEFRIAFVSTIILFIHYQFWVVFLKMSGILAERRTRIIQITFPRIISTKHAYIYIYIYIYIYMQRRVSERVKYKHEINRTFRGCSFCTW